MELKIETMKVKDLVPYAGNAKLHPDKQVGMIAESIRMCDRTHLSDGDIVNVSTFPQDYDFSGADVRFICGMSVPPVMMAHIASEVRRQWLWNMPESEQEAV